LTALLEFEARLAAEQLAAWRDLTGPFQVQAFLDGIPYSADPFNRCPLRVLQDGLANCFDGALLAAAALWRLGYPPLLVNLFPAPDTDDDHVIALYKRRGCFGAVAKSNTVGLRFREPIYRGLRELVMSYFEFYYSVLGVKTLRSYTRPLRLGPRVGTDWLWDDAGLAPIIERLEALQRIPVLTTLMEAELSPVDRRTYEGGLLGADDAGLWHPKGMSEKGS
jgi:hypothetical protein